MKLCLRSDDGVCYMKQFLMASVTISPVDEFLQVSKPVWSLQLETGICCRNVWHGSHLSLTLHTSQQLISGFCHCHFFANANLPVNLFAKILTINRKCNLQSQ